MLESIIGDGLTASSFFICTAVSALLGVLTAIVWMFRSKTTQSFAVTLAILPIAVQIIIMLVNGKVGAGIAVAGAFSLVRFRSVPGTAREIGAIFLAMTIGLATGMGYIFVAFISFAVISLMTLVLTLLNFGGRDENERVLKVTIPENLEYEGIFDDLFEKYAKSWSLEKVKTSNMGTMFDLEYRILLKTPKVPKELIDDMRCRNGNLNISFARSSSGDGL